jgi:thiol peroxidase
MMSETKFMGNPVQLAGSFIAKGVKAPEFTLTKGDLSETSLGDYAGKNIVLNIFPSMDTPVCANSVRKFNKMAAGKNNTVVLCISKDLPFAQGRFCTTEGINNVIPLSDFRDDKFAANYGVLIADGAMRGLLARAVVVVNPKGNVEYTELVDDITHEPNYDAALAVIK